MIHRRSWSVLVAFASLKTMQCLYHPCCPPAAQQDAPPPHPGPSCTHVDARMQAKWPIFGCTSSFEIDRQRVGGRRKRFPLSRCNGSESKASLKRVVIECRPRLPLNLTSSASCSLVVDLYPQSLFTEKSLVYPIATRPSLLITHIHLFHHYISESLRSSYSIDTVNYRHDTAPCVAQPEPVTAA